MPHTTQTVLGLACDSCKNAREIQAKNRDDALAEARTAGWTFGAKSGCKCPKCSKQ